ncbi:MAG: DnaD domain protein [Tenericutes bacterium]|nr:DnaD domain protein [Mycoplasmatota bacterium]
MNEITLLPADNYVVVNKTILTDNDKVNLINLYEPIIGPLAISLYLTLWSDLDRTLTFSDSYNHHHLMTFLKSNLNDIKEARSALEALGLIKTYYKEGDNINYYIYELYSPISAYEFLNHPILNIVLYNNLGVNEYNNLIKSYKKVNFKYDDYKDISSKLNDTFKSSAYNNFNNENIKNKNSNKPKLDNLIDFDVLKESIPNKVLGNNAFNKKTKELINNLAFIYNLDTLKVSEILRLTIDENGLINKDLFIKEVRKYYEYNNGGSLPTIIYRTQPEHLKSPEGDLSSAGKMVYIFENTTPYDFLKSKYKNNNPTPRDLKLLEYLALELNMPPAVINVLIDYVLRISDNKLNKAYVETIAGQWTRLGIKTAREAMNQAKKEYKKKPKKEINKSVKLPTWFDNEQKDINVSEEEKKEIEALLKEFK